MTTRSLVQLLAGTPKDRRPYPANDRERDAAAYVLELRSAGLDYEAIARAMNTHPVHALACRGARWWRRSVRSIVRRAAGGTGYGARPRA